MLHLRKAMLREMKFCYQSDKHGKCRKKCKRSKKKESNLFIFQVIKVTISGKLLDF